MCALFDLLQGCRSLDACSEWATATKQIRLCVLCQLVRRQRTCWIAGAACGPARTDAAGGRCARCWICCCADVRCQMSAATVHAPSEPHRWALLTSQSKAAAVTPWGWPLPSSAPQDLRQACLLSVKDKSALPLLLRASGLQGSAARACLQTASCAGGRRGQRMSTRQAEVHWRREPARSHARQLLVELQCSGHTPGCSVGQRL